MAAALSVAKPPIRPTTASTTCRFTATGTYPKSRCVMLDITNHVADLGDGVLRGTVLERILQNLKQANLPQECLRIVGTARGCPLDPRSCQSSTPTPADQEAWPWRQGSQQNRVNELRRMRRDIVTELAGVSNHELGEIML